MSTQPTPGMPSVVLQDIPMQSEQINELAAALAKAQGAITGAKKGVENTYFHSKYADLAACWDACRGPLSDNGLAVIQTTVPHPEGVTVVTTLAHSSGQWVRGLLTMIADKPGPQPLGSLMSYARRYGMAAIVGLAQVDDDAESATARVSPQKRTKYIKAMNEAVKNQDGPGLLELIEELNNEEQLAIWNELRSDERAAIKKLRQEALIAANGADPNYVDPDQPPSEKDARREAVRKGQ